MRAGGQKMEQEKMEIVKRIKELTPEQLKEFVRRLPEVLGEK